MKKYLFIAVSFLVALGVQAQENDSTKAVVPQGPTTDTVRFEFGTTKVLIIKKIESSASEEERSEIEEEVNEAIEEAMGEIEDNIDKDSDCDDCWWQGRYEFYKGIEIGVNGFLSPSNSLNLGSDLAGYELDYSRSIGFNLNPIEKSMSLFRDRLTLHTGLGLTFNRYELNNNYFLQKNEDGTVSILDTVVTYNKNRLNATSISAPILLGFTSHKNHSKGLHLAVGVIGHFRIASQFKTKFEENGAVLKPKAKGDYNLNTFRLDATARVGFGKINLFANYGITELFAANKGPEVYPFMAGLRFRLD